MLFWSTISGDLAGVVSSYLEPCKYYSSIYCCFEKDAGDSLMESMTRRFLNLPPNLSFLAQADCGDEVITTA